MTRLAPVARPPQSAVSVLWIFLPPDGRSTTSNEKETRRTSGVSAANKPTARRTRRGNADDSSILTKAAAQARPATTEPPGARSDRGPWRASGGADRGGGGAPGPWA